MKKGRTKTAEGVGSPKTRKDYEEAESRTRLADDEIEQAYMDLGFWTDAYAATRTAYLRNLEELEALEAKFGGAGPQKKCGKERS